MIIRLVLYILGNTLTSFYFYQKRLEENSCRFTMCKLLTLEMATVPNIFFWEENKRSSSKNEQILNQHALHISVSAGKSVSYYFEDEILNAIQGSVNAITLKATAE